MKLSWRQRRAAETVAVLLCQVAVAVCVIGIWELASSRGWIDRLAWSKPSAIWPKLHSTLKSDTFVGDLKVTASSMITGFLIGALLGFGLGTLVWRIKAIQRSAEYVLMALQAMPFMIFYPLLLAVFGLTRTPVIILVAAGVVIPVSLNVSLGLAGVPPNLMKMARSTRCGPLTSFWKVRLPAAMPLIFPGFQLGFIYAVIGTIGMEFILASKGLGFRVGASYRHFQPDQMYADIVVVCVFAVLASLIIKAAGRLLKSMDLS